MVLLASKVGVAVWTPSTKLVSVGLRSMQAWGTEPAKQVATSDPLRAGLSERLVVSQHQTPSKETHVS